MTSAGPPDQVRFDLEEPLDLVAALEDARDALTDSDRLAVVVQLEHQVAVLSPKLGLIIRPDVEMAAELLRASEAARRLGVPTKEVLRFVRNGQIRYVMVDGIAHIPDDALEEYQAKAS